MIIDAVLTFVKDVLGGNNEVQASSIIEAIRVFFETLFGLAK